MPAPAYLDARSAAALLGVSRQTLYSYVSRGLVQTRPGATPRERLYRRADLERLAGNKQRGRKAGSIARQTLDWGLPVLRSAITLIREDGPHYRGRSLPDLLGDGFEACAAWLWQCPPSCFDLAPPPLPAGWQPLCPTSGLPSPQRALTLFALAQEEVNSAHWLAASGKQQAAVQLLRLLAASLLGHPPSATPLAQQLADAWQLSPSARPLLEQALIACADHELNASSFAARCCAATESTLGASLCAALATLNGGRHGGATSRVETLLARLPPRSTAVPDALRAQLATGEALPGFGHPLYPDGDPRARLLLAALGPHPLQGLLDAAAALGCPPPSLDLALVAIRHALRLPPGSALLLFALGRGAGWLAHAMEQQTQGGLIRPRAEYCGPPPRPAGT